MAQRFVQPGWMWRTQRALGVGLETDVQQNLAVVNAFVRRIVYGMVTPLAILYPNYRDADCDFYDKPFIGYYMDTWFINAVAENLRLHVSSWLDFVSKLAPVLSLRMRLHAYHIQ
ncbi:hypothetical protein PybrP1_011440 [[Pythium] brassicae (nom. inval.)]|nr:hypothetical protein PybrP1_011440 [[Pythium] brassicae (nom. inval.)]